MQIFLLAANLFALAALLLEVGGFLAGTRHSRLLPLFLLVVSRSLALIIALAGAPTGQSLAATGLAALDVFSTFCIMWALTGPTSHLPGPWSIMARAGAGLALLLSALPFLSIWPIPPEIHSLTLAVFGLPLVLATIGQIEWTHLAAPLLLALANFLGVLDLTGVSWLFSLMAYAFLINAIHWKRLQFNVESYQERPQLAETIIREVTDLGREQERWFEVGEIINNVPHFSQTMEHITQSMAHVTHADQAAIFLLDSHAAGRARLAIIYSPERPVHIDEAEGIVFDLAGCPLLKEAMERQQQILLPQPRPARQNISRLDRLYGLWNEARLGPTLIQPLIMQGRSIGALMLGNPVTNRPIDDGDARLCQALAPQLAALVEYRHRYLELEAQAEAMVTADPPPAQEAIATARPAPARAAVALAIEPEPAAATAAAAPPEQIDQIETYLAILASISNGVVVSDTRGRVRFVNPAAERILGKSRSELMDQPIGTIYGQIDSGEPIEDLIVAFSRRNQPLPTFIETNERAIQGRLIPWRNQRREWLGIIAVFRDATREVKADRARNDFIAALSRELRAPLTAVKGYSELITNGALSDYSPKQIHVQRIIHSSADRMVEVLDNAIQISAENRYQVLPRFEETDVIQVINQALREIRPLALLREVTLGREIKADLPRMAVDPDHLYRILDNLLSNACRFTPPGGHVTLRAWVQAERVGNTRQPHLLLAVADNGVGIPQAELKRIFDPFYQVENQGLEEQSGMGMGLAVVKELVELHNGRVWAESVEGEGSIFQVSLPVAQEY